MRYPILLLSYLWFLQNVTVLFGRTGVDLSIALTSSEWSTALLENAPDATFAIIHAVFYNGTFNDNAVGTIINAWDIGITDLSVFMHPCLNTSQFSLQTGRTCGSATQQLQMMIDELQKYQIEFKNNSLVNATEFEMFVDVGGGSPTHAPSFSPSSSTTRILQRLYVDIEDESPNRYLSDKHWENNQYLAELVNAAHYRGIEVGVYTTRRDWEICMTERYGRTQPFVYPTTNSSYASTNPFRELPLWLPRFDDVPSFDFFTPIWDWTQLHMKQISGGTTALRRIGSNRIGVNFIDDAVPANSTVSLAYIQLL